MLWLTTAIAFLAGIAVVMAVFYGLSTGTVSVGDRLTRIWHTPTVIQRPKDRGERVQRTLARLGALVPPSQRNVSRAQRMMVRAGYRSPEAQMTMRGVRFLVPVMALAVVFATGLHRSNPFFIPVAAAVAGYLVPEIWLTQKIKSRQHRLRRSLPDALDLLVICVEAGLGLDQALLRVSQELSISHAELSQEFQLVNLEMRVGKSRLDALRELGSRTGVDDIKALVAMLVQTDRFGTSVAQSLRVHADDMRTKRRQRAEEMAAKTTIKMVPPLVFFIFPALLVVVLGPAVITLVRQLLPALR